MSYSSFPDRSLLYPIPIQPADPTTTVFGDEGNSPATTPHSTSSSWQETESLVWDGAFSRAPTPSLFDGPSPNPTVEAETDYGPGSHKGPAYTSRFLVTCTLCSKRNDTTSKLDSIISNLRNGDELIPILTRLKLETKHLLDRHKHVRNSDWRPEETLAYTEQAAVACQSSNAALELIDTGRAGVRTCPKSHHPNFVKCLDREEELYDQVRSAISDIQDYNIAFRKLCNHATGRADPDDYWTGDFKPFVFKVEAAV